MNQERYGVFCQVIKMVNNGMELNDADNVTKLMPCFLLLCQKRFYVCSRHQNT